MSTASAIGDLLIRFTADIADIQANTEKVSKQLDLFSSNAEAALSGLKDSIFKLGEAFLSLETVKFAAEIVSNSLEAQASLEQLSIKTGITVETLSGLTNAAATVGLHLGDSSRLIEIFERNVNNAAQGTGRAADALRSLGYTSAQLSEALKNPGDLLQDIASRLNNFQDGIGKTTAQMDIFGRSGAELAPFLKQLAEQGSLNATVSKEQAEAAEALSKQWNTMKNDGQQLINAVTSQMVPTFSALIKTLDAVLNSVFGLSGGIKDLISSGDLASYFQTQGLKTAQFADMLTDMKNGLLGFGKAILDVSPVLGDLGTILIGVTEIMQGKIAKGLDTIHAGFVGLKDDGSKVFNDLKEGWTTTTTAQDAFVKAIIEGQSQVGFYAAATDKAALSVGRLSQEQLKLQNVLASYAKALADIAKAGASSVFTIQQEQLKEQNAAAKRAYDEGAIDFADYYAKQIEIEREGLADQLTLLKSQQKAQLDEVTQLETAVVVAQNQTYKDATSATIAITEAKTKLAAAEKVLIDLGAKITVVTAQQTQVGLDYVEKYLIPANKSILESIPALQAQIDKLALENETIGFTAAQIQQVIIARDEEKLRLEWETGVGRPEVIAFLTAEIEKRKELVGLLLRKEDAQAQISAWQDVLNETSIVFDNILHKGKDTWTQLTDWLKNTLIKELFKLIATKWIIPIIVDVTGNTGLGTALGNQLGPSFLNALFGSGSSAGGLTSGITSAIGNSGLGSLFTSGGLFGASSTLTEFSTGATVASDSLFALAGSVGELIPYVGAAILAYQVLSQTLFKHEPSPVEGTFGIQAAGTSPGIFEDQAYINTKFGQLMIGFLDQGTQQFSGQAALVFDKVVGDSIDAFATRFSPAQSEQFATVLKNMTFQAFSGTFTTEDFLQKYGGQVLQQVVKAAFDILDPALGSVVANFKGTADEVAKFSNTLLSIYDSSKNFNDSFKATIDAALSDATQATADKVLGFVQTVQVAINVFPALATKFEQLSATDIPKFIDALGGAQAALDGINYLYQNFTTTAQKTQDATTQLNADFANLGITAIPQTHSAFLALLASFDLTTDAGRQMYAAVLALAPLFVEVHGTADAAAGSVTKVGDALAGLRTDAQTLALNTASLNSSFAALGVSVPVSHQAFLDLLGGIDQSTDAGKALYDALVALIPAFDAVNGSAQQAADALASSQSFFDSHFYNASEQAAQKAAKAQTDLNAALEGTGLSVPKTTEEFKSLVEGIDRTTPAGEALYEKLLKLAPELYDAATAADALAQAASDAAASAGAYIDSKGIQSFVSKTVSQIDTLLGQSTADFGGKIGTKIGLINDQIQQLNDAIAAFQAAHPGAFSNDVQIVTYQNEIKQFQRINSTLTDQLTRFTILSAQYGASTAEQLVNLQDWYTKQQQIFSGNSEALDALQTIFDEKWKDIIAGTASGVTGTLDALGKLLQGIRDYITQLTQGSLSPLTPLQKLTAAQSAYSAQLALAQSGDQAALGNITKFADTFLKDARDVYASSSTYTDLFNSVVSSLSALTGNSTNDPLANLVKIATSVQVNTSSPTAAVSQITVPSAADSLLTNVLPTGSKIMSTADATTLGLKLDTVNKNLTTLIPALANANTADSKRSTSQLAQLLTQIDSDLGLVPK